MPPVTYPDYAYSRLERFWASDEITFNVGVAPADADAVTILPGATVPVVAPEYVPSEERNPTPGVRMTFQRKKKPSAFSLPMYLRLPATAGTKPSWALFAKKGFGTETVVASTSVRYDPATNIEESSFSLHHWLGNEMRHMRGSLINEITVALSGTAEGRITFAGFAANESFAGVTTLSSAIDAVVTTITVADARRFLAGGVAQGDTVLLQIDDEKLVLQQVLDYTVGTLQVSRAASGSTAATHSVGATVGPLQPGADPKPAELVSSCMLGTVVMGALDLRVIDFEVTLANALEARLDEYGQASATGYRRNGARRISGRFRAYGRQSIKALDSNLERNLEEQLVVVADGSKTATPGKATLTMPRTKIDSVSPAGDGPEFVKTYAFSSLETNGNDELNLVLT
jgi:hypothetical protein